jgi:hypothetical protein
VGQTWLPDVQLMTSRLTNGLYVAAHAGHNGESHNHNDVGDFIIYADGDPVIIDVGAGTYTSKTFSSDRYKLWFNASSHHNVPAINGQLQKDGSSYKARNVLYKKEKDRSILSMNIESAYPPEAALKSWKRTITSGGSEITIGDVAVTTQPFTDLTQTFMTVCPVDISEPGKIVFTTAHNTKVALHYGKEWDVSKEVMQLGSAEEQGLRVTWRNQAITRILLTLRAKHTSVFRYKIVKLR